MGEADGRSLSRRAILAVAAGFLLLAFSIYRPALDGPPISDDFIDLTNPWIVHPSRENLLALFDPTSQACATLTNYKPLSALIHVAQNQLHPQDSRAYHSENVVLHVAASLALVLFLASTGLPAPASVLGGLFFLVHPANVEAVAWMRQLWTPLGLALALASLLALPRRPALATAVFVAALASKPSAVLALPMALALGWCRPARSAAGSACDDRRWPFAWLALWAVICAAYCVAQTKAAAGSGPEIALDPDPWVRLRTMATLPLRYLAMALTSYGVGPAQEPMLARSWLDPWWLASVVVLGAIGARTLRTLRARDPEAVGWIGALAGFAPVSQVFPFLFPTADRYLYFILPGLILAGLHAGRGALSRLPAAAQPRAARAAGVLAFAVCLVFAQRSFERAKLWTNQDLLFVDAARQYPDGIAADLVRSRRAARVGDVDGTVAALRAARDRGWDWYGGLLTDPSYADVRTDPRFEALVREFARRAVERHARVGRETQAHLMNLADAHRRLGERAEAEAVLERAIALGGPLDADLRGRLAKLRETPASP